MPVRLETVDPSQTLPCARCVMAPPHGRAHDQIEVMPLCPECEEQILTGEAAYIKMRAWKDLCAVCNKLQSVEYRTVPLAAEGGKNQWLIINLCGDHIRSLVGRCLSPTAYAALRRQMNELGIETNNVFLLHEDFYDLRGRAISPVTPILE